LHLPSKNTPSFTEASPFDERAPSVDRLSPIDRRPKPPQPAGQAAASPKTPPLARRVELLGQ
jgi:hypothetical protein